ncbi:DUF2325 domain-containing protein [Pseudothauera rhizosphaerae]|uniref:DUF2325 domain-containing protein n=1 Tax=Pseudothauera rhizosphaerae TaxID=2565932 RepID=A0A4S4AXB8_9RHOO|nr:DUF2325 domain-containing protein [Pseudothauera rhizosphaerae]THF63252.1 DUF2325 domain-containing protein [Pseudothauera rhizosphaerae]
MRLSADFHFLAEEHRVLVGRLGRVQQRCSDLLASQAAEIERLRGEVMRLRAHVITRDTALAYAREDLAALRAAIPGLPRRLALARRVEALMQRVQELMRERRALRAAAGSTAAVPLMRATALADLREKAVLCIGRDESGAHVARRMVEMAGGQFLHHTADEADDHAALEASLVAADLVICQSGCVGHNAYWRVQDHCRRTGKQCVLVEQPRALEVLRQRAAERG